MTTECYNVNCPKHGDLKDGPFADCDLVCPEDGLVEDAKNTEQQVQLDSDSEPVIPVTGKMVFRFGTPAHERVNLMLG